MWGKTMSDDAFQQCKRDQPHCPLTEDDPLAFARAEWAVKWGPRLINEVARLRADNEKLTASVQSFVIKAYYSPPELAGELVQQLERDTGIHWTRRGAAPKCGEYCDCRGCIAKSNFEGYKI